MSPRSRRSLLRLLGAAGAGLAAGCAGSESPEGQTATTTSSATASSPRPTETESTTAESTDEPDDAATDCDPGLRPEYAWPLPDRSATNGSYLADGAAFAEAPPVDWSVEPTTPADLDEYRPTFAGPAVADGQVYVLNELIPGTSQREPGRQFLQARETSTGERRWSYELSSRPTRPAVDGDAVLVAADRTLHAVDRHDGTKRWTCEVSGHAEHVVPTADRIHVATEESVCTLDRDGDTVRSASLDSQVTARPALGEDRLYVGTHDGVLRAMNPDDYAEAWRTTTHRDGYRNDDAPGVDRVVVTDCRVFALTDGDIYAFDASGEFVWHAGESYWSFGTDGDAVYAGTYDGYVRALRADDGTVLWERFYGDENPRKTDGVWEAPIVTDEAIYAFAQYETLLALRPEDGAELWTATRRTSDLALAGETLYGVSGEGSLVAMRRPDGDSTSEAE